MADLDVRWKQRLNSFKKAFQQLEKFMKKKELNELENQGLVKAFEFTHELAWNVMKDYFDYQGASTISGSRDATREAFKRGFIKDGDSWMEMIQSRNQTSHIYNEKIANEIVSKIKNKYFALYSEFLETMLEISKK